MTTHKHLLAAVIFVGLLLFSIVATAETYSVNCNLNGPAGKLSTTLKKLSLNGPNTIRVSGTCRENLSISGIDRLTLIGISGAVLEDASNSQQPVVYVEVSREFTIVGFSVKGGAFGLQCSFYATCHSMSNTYTGAAVGAIGFNQANGTTGSDSIVNNVGHGVVLRGNSSVSAGDVTIQGNQGNGIDALVSKFEGTTMHVLNNGGHGMSCGLQSFCTLNYSEVSGNSLNGVDIEASSVAFLWPEVTVTGNIYSGVVTVDSSLIDFGSSGTITGNGSADVVCAGLYPVLRNLAGVNYGTIANCSGAQQVATQAITNKAVPKK